MNLGIEGRRALVTGASEGIGAAIAERLAAEGAEVFAIARRSEPLAALCSRIAEGGGVAHAIIADVTKRADVTQVVADLLEKGAVDILVNNVGGASTKSVLLLDEDDWQEAFERNLFSAVRLTSALLPSMISQGWGRIVHVGSIAAREPGTYAAAYAAAKAALLVYSKTISLAAARSGVLSNAVLPGATVTEAFRNEVATHVGNGGMNEQDAILKIMSRRQPATKRPSTAEEVANAVVFLCSAAASAIAGISLPVDGGTLCGV